jgi:hypothetical protein
MQILKSREVLQMCETGKARQARAMLVDSLCHLNSKNQRIKKRLLEGLFYVELHLGRHAAGFRTLEQRRALGYRKTEQRMDAALHAATLLARQNKAEQARTELLGLIRNPKLLEWHGVLKTLSLYVKVEDECRNSVEQALNRISAAAFRKLGIRLEHRDKKPDVREHISTADRIFGAASRTYSQLLIRALGATTMQEHEAIVRDLRRFAKAEKVGFFRMKAKETLRKLKKERR